MIPSDEARRRTYFGTKGVAQEVDRELGLGRRVRSNPPGRCADLRWHDGFAQTRLNQAGRASGARRLTEGGWQHLLGGSISSLCTAGSWRSMLRAGCHDISRRICLICIAAGRSRPTLEVLECAACRSYASRRKEIGCNRITHCAAALKPPRPPGLPFTRCLHLHPTIHAEAPRLADASTGVVVARYELRLLWFGAARHQALGPYSLPAQSVSLDCSSLSLSTSRPATRPICERDPHSAFFEDPCDERSLSNKSLVGLDLKTDIAVFNILCGDWFRKKKDGMLAVASHRSEAALASAIPRAMDNSGTIDPAALNTQASTITPNLLTQTSPRGTKRSRSPDGQSGGQNTGYGNSSKRSRVFKTQSSANMTQSTPRAASSNAVQTPQTKSQTLPQGSPGQGSPPRSTPSSTTKSAVVKALPTVRDHTTDQLGPEGDEYIPRETDPDGELKVSMDGYALEGRKYKCRTFQVPNRGEKLFMLATECARVLGYRDSYLLFNKNRSLYKIIANQAEKDNLIHQEILPYSYRSRQIAIVTARSMFRQFGSRLIDSGRRVRDDYWEAKARKQGFTEEDAAGEKRPGAAKAREAAAAEASHHATTLTSLPQGEIIYSNGPPGLEGQPPGLQQVSLAPLPMMHLSEDSRSNNYGNVIRPRQEITTAPYQDRIQPSTTTEMMSQATQAAEFNKQLTQQRTHRANYLDDYWTRPHEQPASHTQQPESEAGTVAPQSLQSPQTMAGAVSSGRGQQDQMSHTGAQMPPQNYSTYSNQQNPMASPVQTMHRHGSMAQPHQTPSSVGVSAPRQTPAAYNYQNQMWNTPQPQPSPVSQAHQLQYGQQPSPMPPPQMPQQQQGMGYSPMGQVNNVGFPGMNRSMYQPNMSPQQFNMGSQANTGQQWQGPGNSVSMPQDWQRYQ
nr:chromatin structure-remodeling complex subunit rsc7 [Quercus suber]